MIDELRTAVSPSTPLSYGLPTKLALQADGDASNLVLWAVEGDADAATPRLVLDGLTLLETWLEDGMKPATA